MSVLSRQPYVSEELAGDDRWALAQRIVASQCFMKAPQLREILVYLTRKVVEDNPSGISEYEVGCNVLGRRADFNPNEDNIVRVQVRHLRKKLEDFFNSEGRDEPVLLTIPKGAYVPHFVPRPLVTAAEAESAAGEEQRAAAEGPRSAIPSATMELRKKTPFWNWIGLGGLAVLAIALAGTAFLFWRQKEELRAQIPAGEARVSAADDVLWARFFAPGQPVSVVVADTCLVMLQDILNADIPLRDIAANAGMAKLVDGVQDPKLKAALKLIAQRQYTSLGDVNVAARVIALSERYNARPRIRYARYLDTREFMTGNFMLIGSRRGLPWMQLFEPQLNFYLEQDSKTHSYRFLNRSPKAGEQLHYGALTPGSSVEQSYADIAILPNLTATGYVLIVSGITMEATEAAGELVASNEFSATLAKMLGERPAGRSLPYAEILLETKTMPGTARVSKIICHRLLTPQHAEQP